MAINKQIVEIIDDGRNGMEVQLTVAEVVEQLGEQGVRVVVLPELPKGSGPELAERQEIAVAALACHKRVGLQRASDAMGEIQETAFAAVKRAVHE